MLARQEIARGNSSNCSVQLAQLLVADFKVLGAIGRIRFRNRILNYYSGKIELVLQVYIKYLCKVKHSNVHNEKMSVRIIANQ